MGAARSSKGYGYLRNAYRYMLYMAACRQSGCRENTASNSTIRLEHKKPVI